MRRSRPAQHPTRSAFPPQFAEIRRFMGRTANHRHWFPARVLFEVRFLSPKFPASRACDLRELSQRPRTLSELLSLRSVGSARCADCGRDSAASYRKIDISFIVAAIDLNYSRPTFRHGLRTTEITLRIYGARA